MFLLRFHRVLEWVLLTFFFNMLDLLKREGVSLRFWNFSFCFALLATFLNKFIALYSFCLSVYLLKYSNWHLLQLRSFLTFACSVSYLLLLADRLPLQSLGKQCIVAFWA